MADTPDTPEDRSTSSTPSGRWILLIVPVIQVVFGVWYRYDCPAQPYIPIYMDAIGTYQVVIIFLSILPKYISNKHLKRTLISLALLLYLCLFITGNVWIYSIYEPNYNSSTSHLDPYCHKVLYEAAFWTTTLTYIILGLIIICICGCSCLFGCRQAHPSQIMSPT